MSRSTVEHRVSARQSGNPRAIAPAFVDKVRRMAHNISPPIGPGIGKGIRDSMADTKTASKFDEVADIIAEVSGIERDKITPESHTINDLGIDSLDFLDITFAIDKKFGIKMPVEQWMEDVNEGRASADDFFVMTNLVGKIEELIAAKG